MQTTLRLPKADYFGNFWVSGKPGTGNALAIFPCLANGRDKGGWFVSLGAKGIVWDGSRIKEYKNPMLALDDLERLR